MRKRPPSFRRFSIIAGSWGWIPSAHWRTCNSGERIVLSGDKIKAKAAYEDFLSLWKDADPDVPILKSARAEYDRL